MFDAIFNNWSLIRILRLLMGIALLYKAILSGFVLLIILGAGMCLLPLFNAGCNAGACRTHKRSLHKNKEL